ncbi:unnamed protein product [Brassica rapa]|uniref:Uncharacterized protein n=2 Tax=Brassica TaxID=3705 RepID=A0A3P5YB87_BRACM|nr:unnamed protein product [Brassica napus]CAG7859540.1 unnamed protein product [Brassica rapa]CAF2034456.1 unnamed protein product [Brassica napus]CDY35696.1 BnaC02g09620D [Brassica napus]CDY65391.1 BnaAnng20440D [Brassica napus]
MNVTMEKMKVTMEEEVIGETVLVDMEETMLDEAASLEVTSNKSVAGARPWGIVFTVMELTKIWV